MKDVGSLVVPFVVITGWFAIALMTMVKLASMGGTLADVERAEKARQAAAQAPRFASVAPACSSAQ
jgi:hypothetical protein